jgi:capsular polysaccharide transport system permease protein
MNKRIASSSYQLDTTRVTPVVPHNSRPRDSRPQLGPLQKRGKRRRWRMMSLLLAVVVPTALAGAYLYRYADDQYVTEFRFNVRHESPLRMDAMAATSIAGALGGGTSPLAVITDSQVVIQYLKSRQVIDDMIAAGVDLDAIYAKADKDFLAHLRPHDSVEGRERYWRGMVDPFYDMTTGIVSVEVRAFSPADAQLVATTALGLAEKLVNGMATRAHEDVLAYATREVETSQAKLRAAQDTIATYRNHHAVLFPEMQATSDTSVESKVWENLIEAKTAFNAQLAVGVSADSMQMRMLKNRIAAMETSLHDVHSHLAQNSPGGGAPDASLASVMSEYDVLRLNQDIAAKVYERAVMALQDARNAESQQSVYLAAFVRPGLPQESMYPVRWRIMTETALLSFVAWCLLQLLYHGVRDHID